MKTTSPRIDRRHWLAAAACAAWAWPAMGAQRQDWPQRRATPALQLPGMDGAPWSLASARGRPVLLNFWASWCEPCRTEMPSLELLARRHQAKGLLVAAVNYREGEATVRRFIDTTALALPVLCDSDGSAAKAFGVRAFPTTVAIDRRGRVRFSVMGECDWSGPLAERWLAALL